MNVLRKMHKTYSESLEWFIATRASQERDCGNYEPFSEEEKKLLEEEHKILWEREDYEPQTNWI